VRQTPVALDEIISKCAELPPLLQNRRKQTAQISVSSALHVGLIPEVSINQEEMGCQAV
jgi:hypothetical protein